MNGFKGRAGDRNSDKSKEIADLCVVQVLRDRGDQEDREDREDQGTEVQEDP